MQRSTRVILAAAAIAGACAASVATSQAAKPAPRIGDCFADLMRGSSDEIVCDFPLRPNATERAELERQSRGYVKNAHCTVSIRITRDAVMSAVHTPDFDFVAPAQPVQCEVTANWRDAPRVLPISATFAPKVTIRDGKAIDATPGLADVKGVPRALSWPVETWVNSGIGIKSNMLQVVNAWLLHMRATTARKHAQR